MKTHGGSSPPSDILVEQASRESTKPDRRYSWGRSLRSWAPETSIEPVTRLALGFATTADLPPLDETIGQHRAVSSVAFGVDIANDCYNIFATGRNGTGKTTTVNDILSREAATRSRPDDWIYVHNFSAPHRPNAIRMPAGRAQEFRREMQKLVEDLQSAITEAFESEEYEKRKRAAVQDIGEQQESRLSALAAKAEAAGITMVRTPAGLAIAPKTDDGEAMSKDIFDSLPQRDKKRIDDDLQSLNDELQETMRQVRQLDREGREAIRELDRQVTTYAAEHLIEEVGRAVADGAGDSGVP